MTDPISQTPQTFRDLPISDALVETLTKLEYLEPTPIQRLAIPQPLLAEMSPESLKLEQVRHSPSEFLLSRGFLISLA